MSDNEYLIAYPNTPIVPKWVANTIQSVGELDGNPIDTRRNRSQFESALSVKEPLFIENCYMMIESNPKTYE